MGGGSLPGLLLVTDCGAADPEVAAWVRLGLPVTTTEKSIFVSPEWVPSAFPRFLCAFPPLLDRPLTAVSDLHTQTQG